MRTDQDALRGYGDRVSIVLCLRIARPRGTHAAPIYVEHCTLDYSPMRPAEDTVQGSGVHWVRRIKSTFACQHVWRETLCQSM
jgi:hypothetical protein